MKKLYRSALFAGVLAFGVAACGDDVQIVEGPPAPPPALSVNLTPSNQSINVGETADFAVGVSGGAEGAQASWTCSSSNTGVASVATTDTGCRATGAAAGNASITVTVTKGNQSANAGAQVTVTAPAATTPATITIAAINSGGVPADIDNITQQVDVVLNVDPKDDTIERVVLMVDGVEVASQTYASAVAAMGDDAAAEAVQQITLSFRSDFYSLDEEAGMGVPRHMNGDRTISAALEVAGTEADRPSNTVPVTFRNISGFHVTTDVTSKPSEINTTTGQIWYGGPEFGETEITAYPVLYDGGDLQSVTITFCGDAEVVTDGPFAASYACAGIEGSETPAIASIVDGNNGPSAILNGSARFGLTAHPFPVRIDRVGPANPQFHANPRIRQNGWINAQVNMVGNNTGTTATANNWLSYGAVDAGVGGYTAQVRIAATTGNVNTARAAAPSQSPELPAPSLNNNDYCVIATAVDLLGNESSLPAANTACLAPPVASNQLTGTNHLRFGVDIVAPTIAFVDDAGFLEHGDRIAAATINNEFRVTVADTGSVGVSGMLAGAPVVATASNFNATGTQNLTTATQGGLVANLPLVTTGNFTARDTPGYVTATFQAQDAAGNVSPVVTRSIVFDVAGNVPTFTQALFNTPLSGSTATFTALASDNLDLWKVQYEMTYAGGLPNPILFPEAVFNDFPPVPSSLMNSNVAAGTTINGFMRQLEDVTGTSPLMVGGAYKPTDLDGTVTDASGQTATANTTIAGGAVTDGVSYTAADAAQLIDSWSITAPDAAEAPDVGDAVTLVASAFGPTATFNAPFTRVDFYVDINGNMVQIGTGTQGSTFDDGSAQGRRHQWTLNWTVPEELNGVDLTAAPLNLDIYAIGVNANGDALMTQVNAFVTVTP